MNSYDPRYAPGEILVKMSMYEPNDLIGKYVWNLDNSAIEIMAQHFGWEYLGRWNLCTDVEIIKVSEGQEDIVVQKLEFLSYIDWAERRSLEYEERVYGLDVLTKMLEEIKEGTVQNIDFEGNAVPGSQLLRELMQVKEGLKTYIDFVTERVIQKKLQKLS